MSPVFFLIYIAPILEEMEEKLAGTRLSESPEGVVEIPSYVDDIEGVICDWEGNKRHDKGGGEGSGRNRRGGRKIGPSPGAEKKGDFSAEALSEEERKEEEHARWLGVICDESLPYPSTNPGSQGLRKHGRC